MKAEIKSLTRTRLVTFWGHRYRVTPKLVSEVFGDGKQIVWVQPLATRPDYYVVLVDSQWGLNNGDKDPLCDHLDDVYLAIESEFGRDYEELDNDNGRTYKRNNPFPALHLGCGCIWGGYKD